MPRNDAAERLARYQAALQNPNTRAFLDAIAKAEGTFGRGDNGYNINVGGRQFQSYDRHPQNLTQLNPRLRSDAAGRYQFMSYTWNPLARELGLRDFRPHTQDLAAVALIERRGALNDVLAGNIQAAAYKCRQEWASLPGSNYGQPTVSTRTFMQSFRDAFAAIQRGFNTVVNAIGTTIGNAFRPPEPPHAAPPPSPSGWRMNTDARLPPSAAPPHAPPYAPPHAPQFGPQAAPPPYAPPYTAPHGAPHGAPRPEFRPVVATPPTHPLVNNPTYAAPRPESSVIMGDSIGASMKWAYPNKQNVAVGGVSIAAAASQFRHLRPGTVADVVLGSNNGPYPEAENRRQVKHFLEAADRAGVRINNWVLPGNYQGRPTQDANLARAAETIRQTVNEYNRAHPDRPPIQSITTRDMGIHKSGDGLHLTQAGTNQIRTLIASAQPAPAPAPTHTPPNTPPRGGFHMNKGIA